MVSPTLHHLAELLEGEVSRDHIACPSPGHSREDRSLSVWIDPQNPNEFRVNSFTEPWQVCKDHVIARLGLKRALRGHNTCPRPVRSTVQTAHDTTAKSALAERIWRESISPKGTLVETYLMSARKLYLPEDVLAADSIRFDPQSVFKLDGQTRVRLPAMIALMRDAHSNAPVAIHRTALNPDGRGKANLPGLGNGKRMLGRAKGAVIKLSRDEDVLEGLGITEGIENGLTIICGGWRPVWVCGSADGIKDFPALPGIKALTIFGDPDGTGFDRARACQNRWQLAGLDCTILLPPCDGQDWNDFSRAAG